VENYRRAWPAPWRLQRSFRRLGGRRYRVEVTSELELAVHMSPIITDRTAKRFGSLKNGFWRRNVYLRAEFEATRYGELTGDARSRTCFVISKQYATTYVLVLENGAQGHGSACTRMFRERSRVK